jgi:hypothetical protein
MRMMACQRTPRFPDRFRIVAIDVPASLLRDFACSVCRMGAKFKQQSSRRVPKCR